jgi:hypothetical protein
MGKIKLGKTTKIIKTLLILLCTALICSGCAFLNKEQGYVDDKPQNTPTNWERSAFGIGF